MQVVSVINNSRALLQSAGYYSGYLRLSRFFENNLWLVGGWLRSGALGYYYSGDIDCIASIPVSRIEDVLSQRQISYGRTSLGAFRIGIPDGNHFDVMSTYQLGNSSNLVDTVGRFNFPINSVAANLCSGELVATDEFWDCLMRRSMGEPSTGALAEPVRQLALMKSYEILADYYSLAPPANDGLAPKIRAARKFCRSFATEEALLLAARAIMPYVPEQANAWLVRGFVRAALHEQLEYWDDIDVIVETDASTLRRHLRQINVPYVENYFGSPKVLLPTGRKMDIWTLGEGESIESALAVFSHNVDMVAWPIRDGAERHISELSERSTRQTTLEIGDPFLERATETDKTYAAIKALYLVIRHGYSIGKSVQRLLAQPPAITPFMMKNLIRLISEVRLCRNRNTAYLFDELTLELGSSAYLNVLQCNWKPQNVLEMQNPE